MGGPGPILAIDTSTDQAGVAVSGDGVAIGLSWNAGRNQTISVLDQVDRCLGLAKRRIDELSAIAVANGPGMFTSLRVGLSLAKGLAMANGLPIVGVPTLELVAHPWIGFEREIVAVVPVGRGRVVWKRFSDHGAATSQPVNAALEELLAVLDDPAHGLVVGDVPESFANELTSKGFIVRTDPVARRNPLVLAELGLRRLATFGADDLTLLQPDYVLSRSGAVAGA